MVEKIRITESNSVLRITSEPYVIYSKHGFIPVVDVLDLQSGKTGYIVISAVSLGEALEEIRTQNSMSLSGVTISVSKESAARTAPYVTSWID